MNFDILGRKYCCALYGSGKMEESDIQLLSDLPLWIKRHGKFTHEDGVWQIAVGIAGEDEQWRQDDDVEEFLSNCFQFLYSLAREESSGFLIHLQYSGREAVADFSPRTLGMLSTLKIALRIEFTRNSDAKC